MFFSSCTHRSCSYYDVSLPPAASYDNQSAPRSSEAYLHFLKGQHCLSQQDFSCALSELSEAITHDPSSSSISIELCRIKAMTGNLDEARIWCNKALLLNPVHIEARKLLARLSNALNRSDEAEQQYRIILSLFPDDEESYLSLAALYADRKKYREAIMVIGHFMDCNGQTENALIVLGNIYADMGKYTSAERCFKKALQIAPPSLPARERLVLLYEAHNRLQEAIDMCSAILSIDPDNYTVREKLASLYIKRNDFAAARQHYTILRDTKPYARYDATMKVGMICIEQNDVSCAVVEFSNALNEHPNDDRAIFYLGSALEKAERYDEALHYFSKVPATSRYFVHSQIHRALILERNGKNSEAQNILIEARTIIKDDPDLCRVLASLYEKGGKIIDALNVLKEAVALKPDDNDLLFYLGVLYEKASLFEDSIAVMKKILDRNPEHADALNFIGYSWADRGMHLDEAERLIKKALKLKPDDGYIVDSLGWVYFKQKKLHKARSHLEHAASLVPDDPTIIEHLADVYAASGISEKAIQYYRRAIELDPSKKEPLTQKINALSAQ
ncbi:MAG: tetratricopeptide repeat protein [Desulfobacterota bacterium]|nr:tetratricopeptide repeat protein [Thermodesulfobacteriota bacterium]